MIEIHRHIEILLLANDCVIVPDFGGFMAHHIPARYDADDLSFLPPLRTLGFNPQLRMNDSLLVQSYVEAYDLSYPEALRKIESEVEELKQLLNDEGRFEMEDLGTLTVNSEGNYEFSPCEAGIISPDFYGLDRFKFPLLTEDNIPNTNIQIMQQEAIESPVADKQKELSLLEFTETKDHEDKEKAIQIKLSWIRNAAAIAAAVVAFFVFAEPVANSDLQSQTMSQLQHNILYKLIPEDTNVISAQPVAAPSKIQAQQETAEVQTKAELAQTNEAQEQPKAEQKQEVQQPDKVSYCLVLACQVKKSNAELFVEQLHQKGYEEASVYIKNGVVRVIYGSYETESDAYRQLSRLNRKKEFETAWVYKKKPEA